jgi:hypothetical protein
MSGQLIDVVADGHDLAAEIAEGRRGRRSDAAVAVG